MKNLAVFDFDHTVIDDNSDTAIMKLIDKSKFPSDLFTLCNTKGWTAFMQGVFEILYQNNVTDSQIDTFIKNLLEVDGMKLLITELHDSLNYDVIIISDSNTYFINSWLQVNNLTSKVLKVFSNPAQFDENGLLNIKMFHVQDICKLSTMNLCKGMIMEDFIKEQSKRGIVYNKVVYIGDGYNDLCPILRLKKSDVACCRDNYKCAHLVKAIQEGKPLDGNDYSKYELNAEVCIWNGGYDILTHLKGQ